MPDISMCANNECPVRTTCYRNPESGTVPSYRQSWMIFEHKGDYGCREFILSHAQELKIHRAKEMLEPRPHLIPKEQQK